MPGLRFAISSRTSYISFVKKKKKKRARGRVDNRDYCLSTYFSFFLFFLSSSASPDHSTDRVRIVSYKRRVTSQEKLRLASTFSEPSGGTCVLKCFALLVYSRVVKRAVPQTCRQPACPKLGGCPSRRIRPPPK